MVYKTSTRSFLAVVDVCSINYTIGGVNHLDKKKSVLKSFFSFGFKLFKPRIEPKTGAQNMGYNLKPFKPSFVNLRFFV